jgi:two-component system cell cycle sensor histidine kinase/response regulator CckA
VQAPELTTSEEPREGGSETILLAEDHAELRELVRENLAAEGYKVILASNGEDAVHVFKANSAKIRLAILDVTMPFLGGPEAYSHISAIRPGLPVIFMTGHAADSDSLHSKIRDGAVFLQKPCTPQILSRTVRNALDAKNLR